LQPCAGTGVVGRLVARKTGPDIPVGRISRLRLVAWG
jgi:hypothetical protein